jgi:hypothetical protein
MFLADGMLAHMVSGDHSFAISLFDTVAMQLLRAPHVYFSNHFILPRWKKLATGDSETLSEFGIRTPKACFMPLIRQSQVKYWKSHTCPTTALWLVGCDDDENPYTHIACPVPLLDL